MPSTPRPAQGLRGRTAAEAEELLPGNAATGVQANANTGGGGSITAPLPLPPSYAGIRRGVDECSALSSCCRDLPMPMPMLYHGSCIMPRAAAASGKWQQVEVTDGEGTRRLLILYHWLTRYDKLRLNGNRQWTGDIVRIVRCGWGRAPIRPAVASRPKKCSSKDVDNLI
eukprot:scaffold117158_cov32-Tisochrysis_lutea.AAC.5